MCQVSSPDPRFVACELVRPYRRSQYDPGDRLSYQVTGVAPAHTGQIEAVVERAVGGGFAGQVYRVQLLSVRADDGPLAGLKTGQPYAIKILTPPSRLKRAFRDFLFFLGYQAHFGAQVNPAAVRVGVLWQKLIRRAMQIRLGAQDAVCDTFATFYDAELCSFGEINEWIDGRIWKFEVDERLFDRWSFAGTPPVDHNTPEYVHKKIFMRELVDLLHEMGAAELARQYEWWTCKSQPNVLKRTTAGEAPESGLCAVDFRAGLTLLPFAPMSPIDVLLILRGLAHGRLVQFDHCDAKRFETFVTAHHAEFKDLEGCIDELRQCDTAYRAAILDVTHHHLRPLVNGRLRRSIREGVITSWQSLGRVDPEHAERLKHHVLLFHIVALCALIPLAGWRLVRLWGHRRWREHARRCVTSPSYLGRAMRGSRIETLVDWQRTGRLAEQQIATLVDSPLRYGLHRIALGWWPATWHRAVSDWRWTWQRLQNAMVSGIKFLRVPAFREQWLLDEVQRGRDEGMLSEVEANRVSAQIKDPYIQKYLRCLAVHVCTVPVTQIVMLLVGGFVAVYFYTRGVSWVEAAAAGSAAGVVIQLSPISPGSITRGLFVLYLMIRERDIKNYYVAAPVSFIHVIGYLAFPLQMVTHNPALARFLAGRWATKVVHIVPVFGEPGALLEHAVFDLFFNLPLSLRRAFKVRPIPWIAGSAVLTAMLAVIALLGYARVWEWRQPTVELQSVRVASMTPYYQSGGDLHWSTSGMRVFFDGAPQAPGGPVDYPAGRWDASVRVNDQVNATIRKSFFGDEYDGLTISKLTGSSDVAPW